MRRCSAASERCAQNAAPDAGGTRASSVGGGRQQRASGRGLRARGRVNPRRPKIAWRENAARRRRRFAGVEVRGARARPVWAAGAREGGGCGAKQRLARAEVRGEGQQQQRARRRRRRRRRPSSRKWLSPAFTPVIMNCRPKSRQVQLFALVVVEGIAVCTTSRAEGGVHGVQVQKAQIRQVQEAAENG